MTPRSPLVPCPPAWQVGVALTLVYLCWSTTYFAIQEGVRTLPPMLFGGSRITLAGIVLLAWLYFRRQLVWTTGASLTSLWVAGSLMFVGGNGLINMGQKTVPSGMASVLVATCPLFLALLERLMPLGERPSFLSWVGMLLGLVGVGFLALGRGMDGMGTWEGALLCLGSAFSWALGSMVARHWPTNCPLIQTAALQMLLGGLTMTFTGLAVGEYGRLSPDSFTPAAIFALAWLLIVGSLIGFVAYVWLLGNVSAGLAGSYAYVNPALALLIGWAIGGERITFPILIGLAIILAGVALVRGARSTSSREDATVVKADSDPTLPARSEGEPLTART